MLEQGAGLFVMDGGVVRHADTKHGVRTGCLTYGGLVITHCGPPTRPREAPLPLPGLAEPGASRDEWKERCVATAGLALYAYRPAVYGYLSPFPFQRSPVSPLHHPVWRAAGREPTSVFPSRKPASQPIRYDITEPPPLRCRTVATTADRDRPDPQAAGPGHIQSTDNTTAIRQSGRPGHISIPHTHPASRIAHAKKACLRPAHTPSFTRRSSPSKFLRDRGTAHGIETDFSPLPPPVPYIVVDTDQSPKPSASSPTRQTRTPWR
ncbi:hypothetical protein CMUS01_06847 [Colletotrichum musicola]|uniref:Uncharacterized protein n=1 Tax=Colletotrichum musicola TaxID=2175873 RepID=A0A8H6NGI8_9PEZI|nr:hypothetical protein CMUS01_06847 [Colletotrichum musicola]